MWAFLGDQTPAPPLVIPEELEHPDWSGFICESTWGSNWILVLENLADPMHGPFLHGQSLTLSRGNLEDDMRVTKTDAGFVVEREGQRGVNFDWFEIYGKDVLRVASTYRCRSVQKGYCESFVSARPLTKTVRWFISFVTGISRD